MFITKDFPGRRFENPEELTDLIKRRDAEIERLEKAADLVEDVTVVTVEKAPDVKETTEAQTE